MQRPGFHRVSLKSSLQRSNKKRSGASTGFMALVKYLLLTALFPGCCETSSKPSRTWSSREFSGEFPGAADNRHRVQAQCIWRRVTAFPWVPLSCASLTEDENPLFNIHSQVQPLLESTKHCGEGGRDADLILQARASPVPHTAPGAA